MAFRFGLSGLVLAVLIVTLSQSSAGTPLGINVNKLPGLIKQSLKHVERAAQINNANDIWRRIVNYIRSNDLEGLLSYLKSIPETKILLDYLQENHPQLFQAVCWILEECGNAIEIPTEVIQRIMMYRLRGDWRGLADYVQTVDNPEAAQNWIRLNLPDTWEKICGYLNKC